MYPPDKRENMFEAWGVIPQLVDWGSIENPSENAQHAAVQDDREARYNLVGTVP